MKSYAEMGQEPKKGDRVIDLCGVWPAMTVIWTGDHIGLKTDDWVPATEHDKASTRLNKASAMHTLAPTRSHVPLRRIGMALDTHGGEGTKCAHALPMKVSRDLTSGLWNKYVEPWEKTCPKCKYYTLWSDVLPECQHPEHTVLHSGKASACSNHNTRENRCKHWEGARL